MSELLKFFDSSLLSTTPPHTPLLPRTVPTFLSGCFWKSHESDENNKGGAGRRVGGAAEEDGTRILSLCLRFPIIGAFAESGFGGLGGPILGPQSFLTMLMI